MEKKLPKNWVETELGSIVKVINGYAFKSSDYNDEGIPIIRMSDIAENRISTKKAARVQEKDAFDRFIIEKGDILLGLSGSIGKFGIFDLDDKVYLNQRVGNIRLISDIYTSKKFIYYFIGVIQEQLLQSGYGGAIPNISSKDVENFKIPLPPLPEQERIVAKLDLLFAQHEKMKTALEKIPQLLKDFRQQILSQAVTGKLTEEISYVEVLEEIRNDRLNWYLSEVEISKSKKIKKPQKIVLEVDGDRDYLSKFLYKELDICFIEEIAAKKDNALKAGPFGSSLKKEFYVSEGYKIYGQEQVIKNDAFYGDYYIDEQKFNDLKSCEVFPNDLLISLVGTIGKVLILPNNSKKGIINPRLLKFSFHEFINPFFIKIYLESNIAKNFLKESSHGGTMDVLNLGILKTLPIPLPSLKEQTEIVSRVESLFTKIDAIELRYQKLKEKIDALPQTILHKAFKGELVPQLPTDGDAKDLLKEILALKKEGKKK